jgi:hypothetical protein
MRHALLFEAQNVDTSGARLGNLLGQEDRHIFY